MALCRLATYAWKGSRCMHGGLIAEIRPSTGIYDNADVVGETSFKTDSNL